MDRDARRFGQLARRLPGAVVLATSFVASVAAPVPVRFPEGITHGFLSLTTVEGKRVARGDLLQISKGDDRIESRLVFRFDDGSLHDETVVFTQGKVFTLLSYHIVQKGPAFPWSIDAAFAKSGAYTVTYHKPDEKSETVKGDLELPSDVYNGMITNMVKNLPGGSSETIHVVAFTPKPRVIELALVPVSRRKVDVGGAQMMISEYAMKPDLGGILDSLASLVGKHPPDFHCWIADEEVPAFLRFEGPFYYKTPVYRIDLVTPDWKR